jgi:hypothetical protein
VGIIRNFINISGITPENELPHVHEGRSKKYSDTETIFIPENSAPVESIFEIMVKVDIESCRTVNISTHKILIIDGIKHIKIVYKALGVSHANLITISLPYNTFMDIIDDGCRKEDVKIFIVDAYFKLIDDRKIYSHTLYLACANPTDEVSLHLEMQNNTIHEENAICMEGQDEMGPNTGNPLINIDEEYL